MECKEEKGWMQRERGGRKNNSHTGRQIGWRRAGQFCGSSRKTRKGQWVGHVMELLERGLWGELRTIDK